MSALLVAGKVVRSGLPTQVAVNALIVDVVGTKRVSRDIDLQRLPRGDSTHVGKAFASIG